MANRTFRSGTQTAQAQVDTLTLGGTWENNDELLITLTGEDGATETLTVVSGSTVIATIISTVVAAFNAKDHGYFNNITAAAASGTTITLTADTAGVPFYCSVTTTETGGGGADAQTFTRANTTPNRSTADWNDTNNWEEGEIPVATNDVFIKSGNITYGLRQGSVAIGNYTVLPGHSGTIGAAGKRLTIDPDGFTHHGTGQSWYDIGSANIAARITRTATVANGQFGVNIIGSNMTTLRAESGSVGVATSAGDTATVATVQNAGATVGLGSGCTLTTVNHASGTTEVGAAATTITAQSGTVSTIGSGAVTTLNNNGATVYSNSTGTITTLNQNAGTADFSQNRTARTVTSINFVSGTLVLHSGLTLTNKVTPSNDAKLTATQFST